MGICPTLLGKVMVNFPEGLYLPKRTSAIALPAFMPANQVSTIAFRWASSHGNVSGRPFMSTNTMGLPVAFNACSNTCWFSGKLISLLLAASPLISADSPRNTTATSALLVCSTASSISSFTLRLSAVIAAPCGFNFFTSTGSSMRFAPLA